jgi:4-oxalocrotonate tautomerase
MPFVSIRLVREVIADDPQGKKAEMGRRIATAVSEVTGLAKDQVWVVFEEIEAADWYVGDRSVEEMRAAKR